MINTDLKGFEDSWLSHLNLWKKLYGLAIHILIDSAENNSANILDIWKQYNKAWEEITHHQDIIRGTQPHHEKTRQEIMGYIEKQKDITRELILVVEKAKNQTYSQLEIARKINLSNSQRASGPSLSTYIKTKA